MRNITILSGGQTGADRAALDFAIEHGFPHGGWCPRGRLAEDGRLDERYELRQTPSRRYAQRTEWNVRDGDATVIFTVSRSVTGGTALAVSVAIRLGKPWLHLSREAGSVDEAAARLVEFLDEHPIALLNIAGPRASQEPEVGNFVCAVMHAALDPTIA